MIVRNEKESDYDRITEITIDAFKDEPHSQHTEQFIINALRKAGALTISLVAEIDGKVVGHIAFSPAEISDGSTNWYGAGPLAVTPALQRQGIGTKLMNAAIALLKEKGAKGIALVGDPDYYIRFGYKNNPALILEHIPQEYFMVLPFGECKAKGIVTFHKAFEAVS